jgi:hypothetical protein
MAFIAPALAALGTAVGASGAAATAVGATVASTGVAVLGTAASSLAASNAADFQAKLAQQQAQQATDQASVRAGEVARESRQRMAAARAGAIQNGFELTGSMNDLLDQTSRQGQLDYLTAVYDGSVQATGLNATATNYRRQSSSALIGGALGAGSQALGGLAQVYRQKGSSISVSGT